MVILFRGRRSKAKQCEIEARPKLALRWNAGRIVEFRKKSLAHEKIASCCVVHVHVWLSIAIKVYSALFSLSRPPGPPPLPRTLGPVNATAVKERPPKFQTCLQRISVSKQQSVFTREACETHALYVAYISVCTTAKQGMKFSFLQSVKPCLVFLESNVLYVHCVSRNRRKSFCVSW